MTERDRFGCLPDPAPLPTKLERREAPRGPNLSEQIEWLNNHIRHMEKGLATAIADGKVSQLHADHKLACARALLRTAINLRALWRGQEITS